MMDGIIGWLSPSLIPYEGTSTLQIKGPSGTQVTVAASPEGLVSVDSMVLIGPEGTGTATVKGLQSGTLTLLLYVDGELAAEVFEVQVEGPVAVLDPSPVGLGRSAMLRVAGLPPGVMVYPVAKPALVGGGELTLPPAGKSNEQGLWYGPVKGVIPGGVTLAIYTLPPTSTGAQPAVTLAVDVG